MQHNRLALNIQQIENERHFGQQSPDENEYSGGDNLEVEGEEDEEEYESEQRSQMVQNSENFQEDLAQDNSYNANQMYQSIETFGNQHPSSQQFINTLNQRPYISNPKPIMQKISQLNAETPINLSKSNNQGYSRYSNVDDEVNRIVRKVMGKSKPIQWLRESTDRKDQEKVSKIDKINRELLNENAQLIGQLNDLEKKMSSLCHKVSGTKKNKSMKEEVNNSHFEDKNLMKTLKKYREKLSKALDLKSRLSSRLVSQKSRSRIISNTQRSVLEKVHEISSNSNSESMGIISTIRSRSGNKRKALNNMHKQEKTANVLCKKCCKEIKNESSYEADSSFKRSPMFSPVLQFKQYQITSSNKDHILSQFHLPKPSLSSKACQASLDTETTELQLLALIEEQRELQLIIDKNAKTIESYEDRLLKNMEEGC